MKTFLRKILKRILGGNDFQEVSERTPGGFFKIAERISLEDFHEWIPGGISGTIHESILEGIHLIFTKEILGDISWGIDRRISKAKIGVISYRR